MALLLLCTSPAGLKGEFNRCPRNVCHPALATKKRSEPEVHRRLIMTSSPGDWAVSPICCAPPALSEQLLYTMNTARALAVHRGGPADLYWVKPAGLVGRRSPHHFDSDKD